MGVGALAVISIFALGNVRPHSLLLSIMMD